MEIAMAKYLWSHPEGDIIICIGHVYNKVSWKCK